MLKREGYDTSSSGSDAGYAQLIWACELHFRSIYSGMLETEPVAILYDLVGNTSRGYQSYIYYGLKTDIPAIPEWPPEKQERPDRAKNKGDDSGDCPAIV